MGWADRYAKDLRKRAEGGGDGKVPEAKEGAMSAVGADGLGAPPADGAKTLDGSQKEQIEFTVGLATQQQARCLALSGQLHEFLNKRVIPPNFDLSKQLARNQVCMMQTLATLTDLVLYRVTGKTNIRPIPGGGGKVIV